MPRRDMQKPATEIVGKRFRYTVAAESAEYAQYAQYAKCGARKCVCAWRVVRDGCGSSDMQPYLDRGRGVRRVVRLVLIHAISGLREGRSLAKIAHRQRAPSRDFD